MTVFTLALFCYVISISNITKIALAYNHVFYTHASCEQAAEKMKSELEKNCQQMAITCTKRLVEE